MSATTRFPGLCATAAATALALVLTGTSVGVAAATPTVDADDLQRLVERVVTKGAPGATLLVRDGGSTRTYTSGVADIETGRPMRAEDRYRVGSITKTFVSTLTLQLVERGDLTLESTVSDVLPHLLPDGDRITVRQLLNHTSGLADYAADQEFFERLAAGDEFRPRELVAYGAGQDRLFPPGADWSYSNTNYAVLGLIVRELGDAPVGAQLAERIFEPLGLEQTGFPTRFKEIRGSSMRGYLGQPDGLLEVTSAFSPTWAWAAGAVVSNTADVATFYRGLLAGALVGPAMLEEMKDVVPPGYGLGLLELDTPCGTAFGHDGLYIGYYTIALSAEDGQHQVVAATNVDPLNGVPPSGLQEAVVDAAVAGFCDIGAELDTAYAWPELERVPLVARVP